MSRKDYLILFNLCNNVVGFMLSARKVITLLLATVFFVFYSSCISIDNTEKQSIQKQLPPWQEGYFDIHHINTGRGDATFLVFPDGTTMMFDAGDLDKEVFENKWAPLKASAAHPNNRLTAAECIANYIQKAMPQEKAPQIDYALISHFHEDHYGSFPALGKQILIKKFIDRNYPAYDFPLDLKNHLKADKSFQNYLSFVEDNKIESESLIVGKSNQIILRHKPNQYKNFVVRNVKSNGTIWTGIGEETFDYFTADSVINEVGKYNENPLSLALKISYGDFDYFTGGDMTGLQGFGLPNWFDVETPVAKVVGEVEVMTLNHHGNRDATNDFFVKTLAPKVVVQQSWCSDHPGMEVFHRLAAKSANDDSKAIFATNIH